MAGIEGFKRGQRVQIRCEIQPGAFPDESLVTIETNSGVISGFVRSEFLAGVSGSHGYVIGTVDGVTREALLVRIPGSFFTTAAGMASLPAEWASQNVQAA